VSTVPETGERRGASPVGDTGSVPSGTLLCVPAAPPSGPVGTAPIVAANAVHWYTDPTFLSAAGGAALAELDFIAEWLVSGQQLRWRSLAAGAVLALVAYFRKNHNSVVK